DRLALGAQLGDAAPLLRGDLRAAERLAGSSSPLHPGLDALGDPDVLLLGQGRADRDQRLLEETSRVQVSLGVGPKPDAVALELLQGAKRRHRSLAREAVEGPEQHQVKTPAMGVLEQLPKRG